MKMTVVMSGIVLALSAYFAEQADAGTVTYSGPISAQYYGSFNETPGTGITFSDLLSTDNFAAPISELRDVGGSDTDPNWLPGTTLFGATMTAIFTVSTTGNYNFNFGSDDAGYLFVDGNLLAALPGPRGYSPANYTDFLATGQFHEAVIEYANEAAPGAVLSLGISAVPEPSTWAMMVLGFAGLGLVGYRRARKGTTACAAA
jgi:hypothetical protein